MMICKDCYLPYVEGTSICKVCAYSEDKMIQEFRNPSEEKRDVPIQYLKKGRHK